MQSGSRDQVLGLARRLESCPDGGSLDPNEAAMCVEALRRYAESEAVFEIADVIERRVGTPWHDPRIIQAAQDIARLFNPT